METYEIVLVNIIMQKQSVRIKSKNNLFKLVHSVKTTAFNVRLNSSRNCSVCVRIIFDGMESSFARFNHICF